MAEDHANSTFLILHIINSFLKSFKVNELNVQIFLNELSWTEQRTASIFDNFTANHTRRPPPPLQELSSINLAKLRGQLRIYM